MERNLKRSMVKILPVALAFGPGKTDQDGKPR